MNPLRLFWGWIPRKIECFKATKQSVKQPPILKKRKRSAKSIYKLIDDLEKKYIY